MNRQQRRQAKIKKKESVISIKASDVAAITLDAAAKATDTVFFLMLGIPALVIHDNYPKLMKRMEDGKPRVERFTNMCLELYDSFKKGYLTIDDIHKCLKEEAGITITRDQDN